MSWLWGHTGRSFIDVWSIFHVAFWVFFGSVLWSKQNAAVTAGKPSRRSLHLAGCMGAALLWEVFEKYAEKKWPTMWLTPESWYNSWVSDPLTCVLGVLFALYALDHWRKK